MLFQLCFVFSILCAVCGVQCHSGPCILVCRGVSVGCLPAWVRVVGGLWCSARKVLENRSFAGEDHLTKLENTLKDATSTSNEAQRRFEEVLILILLYSLTLTRTSTHTYSRSTLHAQLSLALKLVVLAVVLTW